MNVRTTPTEAAIDLAGNWTCKLLEQGYCVIPDLVDAEQVTALDRDLAPTSRRRSSASAASMASGPKGLGACSAARRRAHHHVMHPLVLKIVETILSP